MSDEIRVWKKAMPLFEELIDFPIPVALKKLKHLSGISKEEKSLLHKLLLGVGSKNTVIDSPENAFINKHLRLMQNLTGTRMGEYQLISMISKGGMSSIYLAKRTDDSIQKSVAIKVVAPWHDTPAGKELFNIEQTALSKLNHPNIVTMHHGGVSDDGYYFMVMDYIKGAQSLDEYVKTNHLTTRQIIETCKTVALAIKYSHMNMVIHRDLKADNILIDENDHLFVVDFGIASMTTHVIEHNYRVYTPEIASPEQITGDKITTTTDIFSLASTFLTLLIKKPCRPNIDPNNYCPDEDSNHIQMTIKESPLPDELCIVFNKALHIDPLRRYQSMDHFVEDLSAWLSNRPISLLNDSKFYKLKKFTIRNKLASGFAILATLILFTAMILIVDYAQKTTLSGQRAEGAYEFLKEILSSADPFLAQNGDVTIKSVLDANNSVPLESVNNDPFLKKDIHYTLGYIYGDLGFYDDQRSQFEFSLQLSREIMHASDPELLKLKTDLAIAHANAMDSDASVKLANEVIDDLNRYGINDVNIKIGALSALISANEKKYNGEFYDRDAIKKAKDQMVEIIDSPELTDQETIISALTMLSRAFQAERDFQNAEIYSTKMLSETADFFGVNSLNYYYKLFDLAVLKFRLRKVEESIKDFEYIIQSVGKIDEQHSLVALSWDSLGSIHALSGELDEAIIDLTHAYQLMKQKNNHYGVARALDKRSKYRAENYDFILATEDLLEHLTISAQSNGIESNGVISGLKSLVYLLFVIEQEELANQFARIIKHILKDQENKKQEYTDFISLIAIINAFHDQTKVAKEYGQESIELNLQGKSPYLIILSNLIDDHRLMNNQINESFFNEPNDDELVNLAQLSLLSQGRLTSNNTEVISLCEYTNYFRRNRVVSIKKLFLKTCLELKANLGYEIPKAIDIEYGKMNQSIRLINAEQRNFLTEKGTDLIQVLQNEGLNKFN